MKFRNIYPVLFVAIVAIVALKFWERHLETITPPGNAELGTVIKVADGDTLTVETNGTRERLRLCGIDSPEKAQTLGMEAKRALEKMTLGKQIEFTPVEKDRYGRIVAEVFVLGEPEHFVNGDMLEAGLAYHYAQYSQNCPNRGPIIDAESVDHKSLLEKQ